MKKRWVSSGGRNGGILCRSVKGRGQRVKGGSMVECLTYWYVRELRVGLPLLAIGHCAHSGANL